MKTWATLLSAVLVLRVFPVHALERNVSDAGRLADWLMRQQRFSDAELEYERLALNAEEPEQTSRWIEKMLSAAWATDDPAFVLKLARAWFGSRGSGCLPELAAARALYQLRNYAGARETSLPPGCSVEVRDERQYLEGLSFLRESDWAEAGHAFSVLSSSSPLAAFARTAQARSLEGPQVHSLSPGLAAGLNAVIPGAGYAYASRPQTAAAAFVVTGLFTWGAVSTAQAGEKGLAALLSLFALGWYAGGIYGGARAAERENDRRLNAFVSPLEIHFQ